VFSLQGFIPLFYSIFKSAGPIFEEVVLLVLMYFCKLLFTFKSIQSLKADNFKQPETKINHALPDSDLRLA
jgi:hypothetical protein